MERVSAVSHSHMLICTLDALCKSLSGQQCIWPYFQPPNNLNPSCQSWIPDFLTVNFRTAAYYNADVDGKTVNDIAW